MAPPIGIGGNSEMTPPNDMAPTESEPGTAYEDMPPDQMEERTNAVVSSFLDTAKDILSREEKEVLINVLSQFPEILDIVEKVFSTEDSTGQVQGPGTETSDSIPAKLSDGEFVFTAKAVKQIGVDKLRKMMEKAEQEYDTSLVQQDQNARTEKFSGGGLAVPEKAKKDAEARMLAAQQAQKLPPEVLGSGLAGRAGQALKNRTRQVDNYLNSVK